MTYLYIQSINVQRVEYSSRELEQLKLLDAAMDDQDVLDSDSLNFPENDNMNLTDNDEYVSLEEATSMLLDAMPDNMHTSDPTNKAQKSIFENDTEDENNVHLSTVNLNTATTIMTNNNPNDTTGENEATNNNQATVININDKAGINKKD